MMGHSHALTGWCAGLAAAPLVGLHTLPEVLPFATASAGYALLPDLDHPHATASKFLGPVTGLLSKFLRMCSRGMYKLTKGPRDEKVTGNHRHLTHTVLFAVFLGWAATGISELGGAWAVGGVIAFGLCLAADVLGDWLLILSLSAAAFTAYQGGLDDALTTSTGWVGVAVALGCVVHCLGDAATKSGCPFLWPIPIAGETWYELRPPKWLRFRTGGAVEKRLLVPVFMVVGVLLLPGVWGHIVDLVSRINPPAASP
ncbi:metal-dependent hydrolase [Actinophytocola sediminis]